MRLASLESRPLAWSLWSADGHKSMSKIVDGSALCLPSCTLRHTVWLMNSPSREQLRPKCSSQGADGMVLIPPVACSGRFPCAEQDPLEPH